MEVKLLPALDDLHSIFEPSGCAFESRRGALILMELPEPTDNLIRLLLPRLERISVDSYWAHRASGVRGALTKILDQIETGESVDPLSLQNNLLVGFKILEQAAEEYL